MPGLDGARAKVARANEHLYALHTEMQAFLNTQPYGAVTEEETQASGEIDNVLRAKVYADPPASWPTVVGDCIHNLRSALDHVIWTLSTQSGVPAKGWKQIAFPVAKDNSQWSNARTQDRIKHVQPSAALAVIEELQPCKSPNPESHALWVLDELWNLDKHRSLAIVRASIIDGSAGISTLVDADFLGQHFAMSGPFAHNAELARWTILPTGPHPQVDMNVNVSFAVVLEPDGPAKGNVLVPLLSTLRKFVSDAIGQFEPFV